MKLAHLRRSFRLCLIAHRESDRTRRTGRQVDLIRSIVNTRQATHLEEQGFETDSSRVLGVPFVTEGLYNEPKSFQVNDNCQLVTREIKKMILNYELV